MMDKYDKPLKAQKLLNEDFFKIANSPGKVRLWIIKKLFPEFSVFTEKVREWYWA